MLESGYHGVRGLVRGVECAELDEFVIARHDELADGVGRIGRVDESRVIVSGPERELLVQPSRKTNVREGCLRRVKNTP
jgi:hypothetical protein